VLAVVVLVSQAAFANRQMSGDINISERGRIGGGRGDA
jgi:hypothetical protein